MKYLQNSDLLLALDKTGDKVLQEATMGMTWEMNSSLRSKTTKEASGKGNNLLGKILVKLREEFRAGVNTQAQELLLSSQSPVKNSEAQTIE